MTKALHTQKWEQCLRIIADIIPAEQYEVWFKDIVSYSYENDELTILVPSSFFMEQLEERYLKVLEPAIRRVYGPTVQLFYRYMQVQSQPDTATTERSSKPSHTILDQQLKAAPANPFQPPVQGPLDSQLNPKYTFANFCAGQSNKVVKAMAEAIAKDPTNSTFNPLFIFGDVGVGKTHLMQAIGISLKERNPKLRVLYVTARLFESQYRAAVASQNSKKAFSTEEMRQNTNKFFHFYQSIDVLLVDDIQDLQEKPGTQNIFYHIFNHLHQNNRLIVMSSDRAPAEMDGFEDRLLSRFKWGVSARLDRPDLELRRDVLTQKAQQNGVELPTDVREYIASTVTTSVRDLEGVMASMLVHATMLNSPLSLELAQQVVGNVVKIDTRPINFDVIAHEVSTYYNIEPKSLFSKTRKREISDARQVLMYLAKKVAHMSIVDIGRLLMRTHATVNYACNTIEDRLSTDRQLQTDIQHLQATLSR